MGFCTKHEYTKFLKACPSYELAIVNDGIILLKYWLEVSEQEQHKRFLARVYRPEPVEAGFNLR